MRLIQTSDYGHYLKAIVEKCDWKEDNCLQASFDCAHNSSSQNGKSFASVVEDLSNEDVIIFPLIVLFAFVVFCELKSDLSYTLRQ